MKIVINRCFGGFGLSPLAIRKYLSKKGKECYFYENGMMGDDYKKVENPRGNFFTVSTEDLGDSIFWDKIKQHFSDKDIPRNDEDLVAVVEELGENADGENASLSIVDIPDGIPWEISEYDGMEIVEEKHRSWK